MALGKLSVNNFFPNHIENRDKFISTKLDWQSKRIMTYRSESRLLIIYKI